MEVVLATGIYPPDIGGPATYVKNLAEVLMREGIQVKVITFADVLTTTQQEKWNVVRVSKRGGPLFRWFRYAQALKREARNADILYAFSSVSVGVPLMISRIQKPKRVLRLGGDFFWERYTDLGGRRSLRDWYQKNSFSRMIMGRILRSFDQIIFSTKFQEDLYKKSYPKLPNSTVIENALPHGLKIDHQLHTPFRILFMGRFVKFKNLPDFLHAASEMENVRLTLVGGGPMERHLKDLIERLGIGERVMFISSIEAEEKEKVFSTHDVLVVPSLTEISPHTALEARASGLPVLLTEETGLSAELAKGMVLRNLSKPESIKTALNDVRQNYAKYAKDAIQSTVERDWSHIKEDHLQLWRGMLGKI